MMEFQVQINVTGVATGVFGAGISECVYMYFEIF
jgi:hypothetical protein